MTNEEILQYIDKVFMYDPITGEIKRKIRTGGRTKINQIVGWLGIDGYKRLQIRDKSYMSHRIIWLMVTRNWPKFEIDHINQNKSDNSWDNLRDVPPIINSCNRPKRIDNSSGYVGVGKVPCGKYYAKVYINGKGKQLGLYNCKIEAALSRENFILSNKNANGNLNFN